MELDQTLSTQLSHLISESTFSRVFKKKTNLFLPHSSHPIHWHANQPNKRSQSRGPFRSVRRFPSSPNRWLQPCPWLTHQLLCRPRQSSSSLCRPLCCLSSNQRRSTSSRRPLQVRAHTASTMRHRNTQTLTLYCIKPLCWIYLPAVWIAASHWCNDFGNWFFFSEDMKRIMFVISDVLGSCFCSDNRWSVSSWPADGALTSVYPDQCSVFTVPWCFRKTLR